jgi:small subunit ribosomal protein S30
MIGVRRCGLRVLNTRAASTSAESAPQYPEIKDVSWRGRRQDEAAAWSKKIQDLGTVEEKLIAVNMPRHYGWKCIMLRDGMQFYDSLPLCQHLTKTHLVDGLPSIYNTNEAEEAATQLANEVKSEVEEALAFEMSRSAPTEVTKPADVEAERVSRVMETLSAVIVSKLGKHCPHLKDVVASSKPR